MMESRGEVVGGPALMGCPDPPQGDGSLTPGIQTPCPKLGRAGICQRIASLG